MCEGCAILTNFEPRGLQPTSPAARSERERSGRSEPATWPRQRSRPRTLYRTRSRPAGPSDHSSNIGQWRSILTVTDGLHRTPQSGLLSGSGVRMPTLLQTLPSPASSSISEAAVLAREGEVRILASFHTLRGGRCLRRPSPQLRRCHVLPLQDQSLRPCSGATR